MSQISQGDLEKILSNIASDIDGVDGRLTKFLDRIPVTPEMSHSIRLNVLEEVGYERISSPPQVEEGIHLLREVFGGGRKLDYDRILSHAYSRIVHDWVYGSSLESLRYISKLIKFVNELGHSVDLKNVLWYKESGKVSKRFHPILYMREYFNDIGDVISMHDLLKEIILRDLYSRTKKLTQSGVVQIFTVLETINVSLTPEELVQIGYEKLKGGYHSDAIRLIKMGDSLGAPVPDAIRAAYKEHNRLKK